VTRDIHMTSELFHISVTNERALIMAVDLNEPEVSKENLVIMRGIFGGYLD
jgi:hypothetical protein